MELSKVSMHDASWSDPGIEETARDGEKPS